ncbi:7860_t:CDS:2, partial [Paraglomus occultum]
AVDEHSCSKFWVGEVDLLGDWDVVSIAVHYDIVDVADQLYNSGTGLPRLAYLPFKVSGDFTKEPHDFVRAALNFAIGSSSTDRYF